jgi:hypothetical protein
MDASQITKLLQKQNTRYVNRCQTVDSSTLTWQNQIQSSKYIKGVKTCDGQQNTNVPTNPGCQNLVPVSSGNGVELKATGICSFGGAGRTTALQTGSPQQYLSVYSGAAGSAAQVYSSESITLQRAGKESCGVPGTNPAPQNSYVVLPSGGDTADFASLNSYSTINAGLQVPSCSYICTNTNGPTNGEDVPVNNQSNPYLPAFDTYYAMKNPSANCKNCPDQNQKHFVKQCHSRFPNANNGVNAVFNPCDNVTRMDPDTKQFYTYPVSNPDTCDGCILEILEEPAGCVGTPSISYPTLPQFPEVTCVDYGATYSVVLGACTPPVGTFTITPPGPGVNPMTIDAVTGTVITPPLAVLDPDGVYTITYTAGGITLQWQALISGGC